jgi:hypothetical protein
MSERTEQEALFDFLSRMEGRYPLLKYVFHVPNEASGGGAKVRTSYQKRDGSTGYKMTPVEALTNARMGVKKGVWDIWFPVRNRAEIWGKPSGAFAGLTIEMKAKHGALFPEQWEWHDLLCSEGWGCGVCNDWPTAARLLIHWVGGDPNEIEGL